jgi:hypothetical protein
MISEFTLESLTAPFSYGFWFALAVFISQVILFHKLRIASAFLLACGAAVFLIAIFGEFFILPSGYEFIEDGDITHSKAKGWGPFLGSFIWPGILVWVVGMFWFTFDVWRGQIANK